MYIFFSATWGHELEAPISHQVENGHEYRCVWPGQGTINSIPSNTFATLLLTQTGPCLSDIKSELLSLEILHIA